MTREQLLASLALVGGEDLDAVHFGDGRYLNWASYTEDGRGFELGTDIDTWTVTILSWAEIERVHRALTVTLLNHTQS